MLKTIDIYFVFTRNKIKLKFKIQNISYLKIIKYIETLLINTLSVKITYVHIFIYVIMIY